MLWNVFADAAVGAAAASIAGSKPLVGAAVGGMRAVVAAGITALPDSPDVLLRRGAFDLAARVRGGLMKTEPMPALLSRFLTAAGKQTLGL